MSTSGDYAVIVNYGRAVAASFTAAVSAATAATVLTTNHLVRELLVASTLDADMILTFNGANWIPLPAGAGAGVDGIRVFIPVSTVIGAYAVSGTPTTGWLGMSGI